MPFKDKEAYRQYQRAYQRRWYQANKEKHIALVRNRGKQIKAWLREYKETRGCEVCGEPHPACLEFHHIDPQEKRFSIGRVNDYLGVKLMRNEIAKCRLLCTNCHRKEHWHAHRAKRAGANGPNKKRIKPDKESQPNPFLLTE